MTVVLREKAKIIDNLPEIESILGFLKCARTIDHREFSAKSTEWPEKECHRFPIRLAMEYIYYAVAQANEIPMPAARVLEIDGATYWGMQIENGRRKLGVKDVDLPADLQALIKQSFEEVPAMRDSFLRVSFLDVLLLNADRTQTNVLKSEKNGRLHLSYLDHEQSLGWRNEPNVAADNKIKTPVEEYERLGGSYGWFFRKYKWALTTSLFEQRSQIFETMKLDAQMFDEIRPGIPDGWIDDATFLETKTKLLEWRAFLEQKQYSEIDQKIFGGGA